jgi:hypothetical protein
MSKQFNVGDKVRLLDEVPGEMFMGGFMPEMQQNVGQVYEIKTVLDDTYRFVGLQWVWDKRRVEEVKAPQKSIPGSYATGKGTTARIMQYLEGRVAGRSLKEIGNGLGLQSRQLSKRLAEQVKAGTVQFFPTADGRVYHLTKDAGNGYHPDFESMD